MKNIVKFMKKDFISKLVICNFLFIAIYSSYYFQHLSKITASFIVGIFVYSLFAIYRLYTQKVTIKFEHFYLLPIIIFLYLGIMAVYTRYNDLSIVNPSSIPQAIERVFDFFALAMLAYNGLLVMVSIIASKSAHTYLKTCKHNILVMTGSEPDFIHYKMMRHKESHLVFSDSIFTIKGYIHNGMELSYRQIYDYMKEQQRTFESLSEDDFNIIHMLHI